MSDIRRGGDQARDDADLIVRGPPDLLDDGARALLRVRPLARDRVSRDRGRQDTRNARGEDHQDDRHDRGANAFARIEAVPA